MYNMFPEYYQESRGIVKREDEGFSIENMIMMMVMMITMMQVVQRIVPQVNTTQILPSGNVAQGEGLALKDIYAPVFAHGSAFGAQVVILDLSLVGGRSTVEIFVQSDGPATFLVEGSNEGNWRLVDTITITKPAGDSSSRGYLNAYPMIRVHTSSQVHSQIEITAGR